MQSLTQQRTVSVNCEQTVFVRSQKRTGCCREERIARFSCSRTAVLSIYRSAAQVNTRCTSITFKNENERVNIRQNFTIWGGEDCQQVVDTVLLFGEHLYLRKSAYCTASTRTGIISSAALQGNRRTSNSAEDTSLLNQSSSSRRHHRIGASNRSVGGQSVVVLQSVSALQIELLCVVQIICDIV